MRSILSWQLRQLYMIASISFLCFSCESNSTKNSDIAVETEETNSIFSYAAKRDGKDSIRLKIPNHPLKNEEDLNIL